MTDQAESPLPPWEQEVLLQERDQDTYTMCEIMDAFRETDTTMHTQHTITEVLRGRREYAVAEAKWNAEHGLTATCPECFGAMRDDGRTVCTFRCYHARVKRLGAVDNPEFENPDNHPHWTEREDQTPRRRDFTLKA